MITEIRRKLELTQSKFAEKLGVSRITVNRWENLVQNPSKRNLKKIVGLEDMIEGYEELSKGAIEYRNDAPKRFALGRYIADTVDETSHYKSYYFSPLFKIHKPTFKERLFKRLESLINKIDIHRRNK